MRVGDEDENYNQIEIDPSDEALFDLTLVHRYKFVSSGPFDGGVGRFLETSRWDSEWLGGGEWLWNSDFSWALLGIRVLAVGEKSAKIGTHKSSQKKNRGSVGGRSGKQLRSKPSRLRKRKRRSRGRGGRIRPFRFVVISDTHNAKECELGQGVHLGKAVEEINSLEPDFVVALGDLVAGGGDCKSLLDDTSDKTDGDGEEDEPMRADLEGQLHELSDELIDGLKVPLVVVEGNHDLSAENSENTAYPREVWGEFWQSNRDSLLKAVRRRKYRRSYRFRYNNINFVVLGDYDSLGLEEEEIRWAKKNIRRGDVVFRHGNLYGVSCCVKGYCGFAIRDDGIDEYEKLHELLKKRKIKALFSAHTHAFYHGVCGGVPFINSGSLGDRSLEFVKGWEESPFKERQAYVVVEVLSDASLKVRFRIFDSERSAFVDFDPKEFPPEVEVHRVRRFGYEEGIDTTCKTVFE